MKRIHGITYIFFQFSWKLIHPAEKRTNKNINDESDDYEKVQ